jgi:hypothetical protein
LATKQKKLQPFSGVAAAARFDWHKNLIRLNHITRFAVVMREMLFNGMKDCLIRKGSGNETTSLFAGAKKPTTAKETAATAICAGFPPNVANIP